MLLSKYRHKINMFHLPHDQRLTLSTQKVSQYHLNTACIIADQQFT